MTRQEKKFLLQKYFRGECSPAEQRQVQVFLQQADTDVALSQLLDEVWQEMKVYPEMDKPVSENIFQSITQRIQLKKKKPAQHTHVRQAVQPLWRIAAAIALLIVFSGVGYRLFWYSPDTVWQTAYGQTASIILPDQSVVMLNGNSRVRYKKQWKPDATREVWLEGEGFFKVVHTKNHRKFVVHTAGQVAVEVLGTTFTVARRKTGTRVVLNSGKVRLNVGEEARSTSVDLKPGDLVQIKPNTKKVEKHQVNPDAYSSWTKQVLSFNNTPLREVVALLEETYGLDVSVSDASLYSRRISGSTPITKDLNLFFIGLEQTFDLKITRKGKKVEIAKLHLESAK